MKHLPVKYFLALGAALFAFHAPVMAASSEELTEIRSQLRNLLERVERLEQENDALKTQNEALQAQGEHRNPKPARRARHRRRRWTMSSAEARRSEWRSMATCAIAMNRSVMTR